MIKIVIFLEQSRLSVLLAQDDSVQVFRIKGEVLYEFQDKFEALRTTASYIQSSLQLKSFSDCELYLFSAETSEELFQVVSEMYRDAKINLLPYGVIDQFVELAVTKDLLEAEKLNAEVSKVNKELNSEINELKAKIIDLNNQMEESSILIKKLTGKNKKLQDFYDDRTKTKREIFYTKVGGNWVGLSPAKKSGDYVKTGEKIGSYKNYSNKPDLSTTWNEVAMGLIGVDNSAILNASGSGYLYWLWDFSKYFQPKNYIYKNSGGLLALAVISNKKDDTMEDIEEFVKSCLATEKKKVK